MNWVSETRDASGVVTVYPPEPSDLTTLPQCSYCQNHVQFLAFYPQLLQYCEEDEHVPRFCGFNCASNWLKVRTAGKMVLKKLMRGQ